MGGRPAVGPVPPVGARAAQVRSPHYNSQRAARRRPLRLRSVRPGGWRAAARAGAAGHVGAILWEGESRAGAAVKSSPKAGSVFPFPLPATSQKISLHNT